MVVTDAASVLVVGIGVLLLITFALTALAGLLRARNALVAHRWAVVEARWHDLLLQVLAGVRSPAELHATVRMGEERYLLEVVSRFARRLRGEERFRCAEVVQPYLHHLLKRARHREAGYRAQAVHALGLVGMDRHVGMVTAALNDPSEFVAMTAMRALARPEHAASAPELLGRLDRFTHWDPSFLASILAAIGPSVSPALLEVLADESASVRVRQVAARTLLKLNYLPAGSVAASVAKRATDRDLVASCLRLLGAVGHNGHLPAIRLLADSPDEVVRQQAVRALGSLEEPAKLPRLLQYLHDESPWVAMEAGRALARFGDGSLLSSAAAGSGRVAVIAGQALMEARG